MRQPQTLFRRPQYEQFTLDNMPLDASITTLAPIYEGDLVYWTGTGIAPLMLLANAGAFMGLSQVTAPLGAGQLQMVEPQAGASAFGGGYYGEMPAGGKVNTRAIADLYMTAGETYKAFQPITVGADAQTITNGGGTGGTPPVAGNIIGHILPHEENSALLVGAGVVGVANTLIRVQLYGRFPTVLV